MFNYNLVKFIPYNAREIEKELKSKKFTKYFNYEPSGRSMYRGIFLATFAFAKKYTIYKNNKKKCYKEFPCFK